MRDEYWLASAAEWQLYDMGDDRKERLMGASFVQIVQRIESESLIGLPVMKKMTDHPGMRRVEIRLSLATDVVDLFHNGAGGFRAQFLRAPSDGIRANRFIFDILSKRIVEEHGLKGTAEEVSLRHEHARAWINEGAWLTDVPVTCRGLTVPFWENNASKIHMGLRFEADWARKVPDSETEIVLKGGCVDADGNAADIDVKPSWAYEVHTHGYS